MVKQSGSSFAVVTGASSGIGFHLARVFAENGFDVLITAEDARLADAEKQLSNTGVKIYSVPADLTKSEEVERLWKEIQATQRPVDAIAINAGIGAGGDFARETDLNDELQIVDLNVRSTVQLAKYVVKQMVDRGAGRILFTASIAEPCLLHCRRCMAHPKHLFWNSRKASTTNSKNGRNRNCFETRGDGYRFLPPRGYGRHRSWQQG